MSSPIISVVIPVYNAEKYIKKCIDSIINQTYEDWELILVDDGSNDHSYDICKKYEKKDNRIILISQENAGVSAARNKGLSCVSGEYVCFIDSDDYIEKNMLEILYKTIIRQNAGIVICGMKRISKTKTYENSINGTNIYGKEEVLKFVLEHYLEWLVSSPCGKLYKAKYFPVNGFDHDISLGEDLKFNIEYFENIDKISIIPDTLYCYFNTKYSLTKKYSKTHYKAICDIYALTRKYTEEVCQDYKQDKFYNVNYKLFTSCMAFLYQNIPRATYHEEREFIITICENKDLQLAVTKMKKLMRTDQKLQKFMLKRRWIIGLHMFSALKYAISIFKMRSIVKD